MLWGMGISDAIFQKKFCLAKSGGPFEFSNFLEKLQNTKMLISRKLQDRVISIFVSPNMVAILNFQIFRKNHNTKCLYLDNCAR